MIKILKRRLGFATNSSSMHSIVFVKDHDWKDSAEAKIGDFGWNHWTAASTEVKRRYLATQLMDNIVRLTGGRVPNEYYRLLTASLCGVNPGASYIDHQSVISLPRQLHHDVLDIDYYRQFALAMEDARILILGGNDNTGVEHPARQEGNGISIPFHDVYVDTQHGNTYPRGKRRCLVARYDELYDQWVLFNQYTGEKVRLSFKEFKRDISTDHPFPNLDLRYDAPSGFPELVDVKITDYCERGCVWCYQGSGRRGRHAEYKKLMNLVDILDEAGVLEVAIGGGEPTLHPDFARIMELFRSHDIVPNFSTGRLDWLEDKQVRDAVCKSAGGWAYTVRTPQDVNDLVQRIQGDESFRTDSEVHSFTYNPNSPIVSVHIVLGTLKRQELRTILEKCAAYNLTTTLLGYKQVGKAKGRKRIDYSWLMDDIKAMRSQGFNWNISIDTALAREFHGQIKASPLYYDLYEAARSMYIDAVEGTIAPYSYGENRQKLRYLETYDSKWVYKAYDKMVQKMRKSGADPDFIWGSSKLQSRHHKAYVRSEELEAKYQKKGAEALLKAFRAFQRQEQKDDE